MNKILSLFLSVAFFATSFSSFSAWDIYKTGVQINGIYLDVQPTSPSDDFLHYNFGRFNAGGSITLNFAEVFTFKNGGDDVCSENRLFYRVYRTCDAAPAFTSLFLPFNCENGGSCTGTTNFGDQRWAANPGTNIISGLTLPGQYVIELFFESRGTPGTCATFKYASNGGANYFAYFTLGDVESFTDGNSSADPIWTGETGAWQVVNNSDASGLLGTELIRTHTLRLNSLTTGSNYISTQITNWDQQQNWYFWVGRRNQGLTGSNFIRVWLYSTQENLESGAGLNGYFLQIGQGGNDIIELYRVTGGGTPVSLFSSSTSIFDGLFDFGVSFHISRSETGVWTIRTSPLPQNSTQAQASATARSCPENSSTVVHGTVLDNTHIPASGGYFGLVASVPSVGNQSVEFDNFRFVAQPANTKLFFTSVANTVTEAASIVATSISVSINSASLTTATSVQVVLTSGDGTRLAGYAPQTLTWGPGITSAQTAIFNIAANTICDDIATLNFQLQNPTGGLNATVAEPSNFTLTIIDDDTGYATVLEDNLEDGNAIGWTSFGNGSWIASNISPASGTFSLRHSATGSGSSHAAFNTEATTLSGVNTTWRFNVRHFNRDPAPNDKFLAILAASNTNFFGSFNGYAIGVDPVLSGDPDIVNFYRVDNGVLTSLATTSLDITTLINEIGFEIIRSETGVWTIRIDASGDFDNLVTEATVTETTHDVMGFFGIRYVYSSINVGRLSIDDVLITQKGCKQEYFSQVPGGNFNAAIWSDQPVGTPVSINSGRFTRLTIQENAPVTLTSNTACGALNIAANAVLNAGSQTLRIFESVLTGTGANFNAGTSTVIMKGTAAQLIAGTGEPSFYNLTIDNDFGTVSLVDTVRVQNQLVLEEGTLQTGGRLILLSTATRTAGIAPIPATGADISGDVIVQRFVPNAGAGYIYLGVVATQTPNTIEAVWDDDLVTTGVAGSDFPPPYNFVNIYSYNETAPGGRNNGWTPMTNTSNVIDANRGYSLYVGPGTWNVDVVGAVRKGNISIPLSWTNTSSSGDGWNLVANIYPSEIDWLALESNSNDVNNYFVYDDNLPGYRSFSANLGVGSASRYIAHSQAFFVRRGSTPANQFLNFVETVKSSTNSAFERSTEEASFARISISRNGQSDEAVLAFHVDATNNYDVAFDAEKLESPVTTAPELAFVSADNVLLTIDARPMPSEIMEIPVYLDLPAAGSYTIAFPETQNIPFGSCLVVEDVVAGESWALEAGLSFVVSTSAPYQGNRIIIRVSPSVDLSFSNVTCNGAENGEISIETPGGAWNWTVTNELGTTVFSGEGSTTLENVGTGFYLVTLNNVDGACATLEQEVVITEPAPTEYSFESSIGTCNASTGEVLVNINNPTGYTYWLTNAITEEVVTTGQGSQNILVLSELPANEYLLTIVNSCSTVEHTFSTIDANTIFANAALPQTEFSWEQGTEQVITLAVEAYNATQVLWLLDGVVVGEGHSIEYTLTEAGTYVFTAVASNEGCESTVDATVVGTTFITIGLEEEKEEAFNVVLRDGGALVNIPSGMNNATLRVVSMNGQVIFEKQNVSNAEGQLFIPMAAWASGVYNFNLFTNASTMTQNVIKE